jgi:hypothetical protein
MHPIPLCPPDPFQSGRRTNCLHWKLVQQNGQVQFDQDRHYIHSSFSLYKDKATMDNSLNHGDDLPKELLSKTNWNDFKEPIVGTLIPIFFITYFGQDLPHGNISNNKMKAKLVRLGTGDAVKKLDHILSVMEEIKTPESIKKHFDPNWDAKSLPLATSNSPFSAMTLVQSNDYPVAARVIKDLFQLSPQAAAPTLASYAPSNVMLHLPAKADKESEAKQALSS